MLLVFIKFLICSILIVVISKNILASTLRKLAEGINLKPKIVGNIAGIATSVPELLSVGIAGFTGLIDTGIFNILSSNVINIIEYTITVFINKNTKNLKNKAIIIELILTVITIIIPIVMFVKNIELDIKIVVIFFIIFSIIDSKAHKKYFNVQNKEDSENTEEIEKASTKEITKYIIILIISAILLFVIGNILSDSLEMLCNNFGISQIIIGILLGIITSAPEFITFNEAQKYHKKENREKIQGVIEATNNLISSNMLNLFIIQSVGIIIYLLINNH